jgi:hypothetical protein
MYNQRQIDTAWHPNGIAGSSTLQDRRVAGDAPPAQRKLRPWPAFSCFCISWVDWDLAYHRSDGRSPSATKRRRLQAPASPTAFRSVFRDGKGPRPLISCGSRSGPPSTAAWMAAQPGRGGARVGICRSGPSVAVQPAAGGQGPADEAWRILLAPPPTRAARTRRSPRRTGIER